MIKLIRRIRHKWKVQRTYLQLPVEFSERRHGMDTNRAGHKKSSGIVLAQRDQMTALLRGRG